MNNKAIITLFIVAVSVWYVNRSTGKKHFAEPFPRAKEARELNAIQAPQKKTKNQQTGVRTPEAVKNKAIRTLNVRLLAKLSEQFRNANPNIDFSKLTNEQISKLKLPKDSNLIVLRSPKCGENAPSAIGKISSPKEMPNSTIGDVPQFVSVQTNDDQTLGSLAEKVDKDPCIVSVLPNGSIDSVRIPASADLKKALEANPDAKISEYDFKEVFKEGYSLVRKSFDEGNLAPVHIYFLGSTIENSSIPSTHDLSEPYFSSTVAKGGGQIYMIPLPPDGQTTEQIADASNSVLAAIASGANFVLLPSTDPEVFSAVAEVANANNVKVYMVPRDKLPLYPPSLQD